MAWLSIIIPIVLKVLELWLNNKADKAKAYKEFLAFIEKMHPTAPAELQQSYESQKERVRRELEKLDSSERR